MDVVAPAVLMPFAGTLLGAAFVFLLRNGLSAGPRKALTGFAAGVMTAASSWSLMLPAMESCAEMGRLAFLPATAGFLAGVAFLLALDVAVPHMHADRRVEGPKVGLGRTAKERIHHRLFPLEELFVQFIFAHFIIHSQYPWHAAALP